VRSDWWIILLVRCNKVKGQFWFWGHYKMITLPYNNWPLDTVALLVTTYNFRCFGFLEFKDPASLTKVIESRPHTVDGKEVCMYTCVYVVCVHMYRITTTFLNCWGKIQGAMCWLSITKEVLSYCVSEIFMEKIHK